MTYEELKKEIDAIEIPEWSRRGQFVFNYIDAVYHVARAVQFEDKVDCFHRGDMIDEFIKCAAKRIKK